MTNASDREGMGRNWWLAVAIGLMTLVGAAPSAEAGFRWSSPVYVCPTCNPKWASGALSDAHLSADSRQNIGCYTYATTGAATGYCWAVTSTGVGLSCTSTLAAHINLMHAIKADSYVYFQPDAAGRCIRLQVENSSEYQSKH